jgi:hypothetical protein
MGFGGTKLSKIKIDANLNMGGYRITDLPAPSASTEPARSADLVLSNIVPDTDLDMLGNKFTNLGVPSNESNDAARVVDLLTSNIVANADLDIAGFKIINQGPPAFATDGARYADLPFKSALTLIIDGGGEALTAGLKGFLVLPFTGTLTGVELEADLEGSIVVDIWKNVYDNFPPTVTDSITDANKPTISVGIKYQDLTLTGWNYEVTKGDILAFNIESVATITRITITLYINKNQ